jgi:hypothetical protein
MGASERRRLFHPRPAEEGGKEHAPHLAAPDLHDDPLAADHAPHFPAQTGITVSTPLRLYENVTLTPAGSVPGVCHVSTHP